MACTTILGYILTLNLSNRNVFFLRTVLVVICTIYSIQCGSSKLHRFVTQIVLFFGLSFGWNNDWENLKFYSAKIRYAATESSFGKLVASISVFVTGSDRTEDWVPHGNYDKAKDQRESYCFEKGFAGSLNFSHRLIQNQISYWQLKVFI